MLDLFTLCHKPEIKNLRQMCQFEDFFVVSLKIGGNLLKDTAKPLNI